MEPEPGEALLTHRHEEREVVDIDEVAEGADDHGRLQEVSP